MKPKQIEKLKIRQGKNQNTFLVSRPLHVKGGVVLTKQELTLYDYLSDDNGVELDDDNDDNEEGGID